MAPSPKQKESRTTSFTLLSNSHTRRPGQTPSLPTSPLTEACSDRVCLKLELMQCDVTKRPFPDRCCKGLHMTDDKHWMCAYCVACIYERGAAYIVHVPLRHAMQCKISHQLLCFPPCEEKIETSNRWHLMLHKKNLHVRHTVHTYMHQGQ